MFSSIFIVFVPIDRFIFGSKLSNQPAYLTEKKRKLGNYPLFEHCNFKFKLFAESIYQCVN